MARKAPLKVVTESDQPTPRRRRATTLKAAVQTSERDLLVTMRAKVASEIDGGVPPAYLAPLMRQLRELDKEIRALDIRAKQEADEDATAPDEEWDSEAL